LKFILTGGHRHDVTQAIELLEGRETTRVIADKGYDAQSVLDQVVTMGAEAVIPPKSNRLQQRDFDREFYRERHLAECFFNKLKQFRRVSSRFEQLGRNYLAFVQFASVMIWLR
jgi:transposase